MQTRKSCCCTLTIIAALLAPVAAVAASDDVVPVGRYTTVDAVAEAEVDPLATVAQLRFPRDVVSSVGDALRYLLQRTGYAIRANDDYSTRLFELPLPDSQRQLGPARVTTLAQTITGNSYRLCIDRYSRQVVVQALNSSSGCPAISASAPATTSIREDAEK